MLETLKRLLTDVSSNAETSPKIELDEARIAEAALMFHVIAADGIVKDEERARMKLILREHFELTDEDTEQLIEEGKQADMEAIDLFRFTSILKRELEPEERTRLISNLWEMVFADGEIHELEDNIVWRVADLLNVTREDRMKLKRRIRKEAEGSGS